MPPDSATRARWAAQRAANGGGAGSPSGAGAGRNSVGSPSAAGSAGGASVRRSFATLWYLDASGKLESARVRTGLTDGQKTEVSGQGITDGTRVIVGVTQGTQATAGTGTTTSPFQQQSRGAGGPPRPGGF
jgi:hypothetical protein